DGRVARARHERQVDGADGRGARVGGVGRSDRDAVRARGEVERAGQVTGLEVVERQLAVDVDVDDQVGDAVEHREGRGVAGGGGGGESAEDGEAECCGSGEAGGRTC